MITKESVPADNVNHPSRYIIHPSYVEAIQIAEHMGFCLGSAIKYIMRCDEKGDAVEDLKKAVWYLEREIAKREIEFTPIKTDDELATEKRTETIILVRKRMIKKGYGITGEILRALYDLGFLALPEEKS